MTTSTTPTVTEAVDGYLAALTEHVGAYYAKNFGCLLPNITFKAEYGRKFVRIVQQGGHQRHVHAFVDVETLDVIKPAGWKAPQRGVNGLAVRGSLATPEQAAALFSRIDPHGGYLYAGREG